MSDDEVAERLVELEARVDKLLAGRVTHPPNARLLAHLAQERDALFSFLRIPGVHQLAGRAGPSPPDLQSQALGRQQDLGRGADDLGVGQHLAHLGQPDPIEVLADVQRRRGDPNSGPILPQYRT